MRVLALFVFFMAGFILFGNHKAYAETPAKSNEVKQKIVKVKEGDTLIKIAKTHKTTYQRIFYANKNIKNPDIIHPGDRIRIPHKKEKLKKRPIQAVYVPVSRPKTTLASYSQPVHYQAVTPTTKVTSADSTVWDKLAACESGGNWAINTGNGYYGGLQFNVGTWQSNGGKGFPHQASRAEQIRIAENLRAARGFSPWPACSAKLGLS